MGLIRILQFIEETLLEIALWIIFVPKTLIKIIFFPSWCQTYLVKEWEKEASEKYNAYVSPMIFLAIICIAPYFFIVDFVTSETIRKSDGLESRFVGMFEFIKPLIIKFSALPLETKFLLIALFLLASPLLFSIGILKSRREPLSRKSIHRIFYTQCYCFAPAFLFSIPYFLISLSFFMGHGNDFIIEFEESSVGLILIYISWALPLCWLLIAETKILMLELRIGWRRAIIRFFIYLFFASLLMYISQMIIILCTYWFMRQ